MRLIESIVLISLIVCCQSTALTLAFNQIYQCQCGNVSTKDYCPTTYCIWNTASSTCSNKDCTSFLAKSDCQGVPDPFNCVWNYTTSKCESFKKCSDYTFNESDAKNCYDLIKCQVDLDKYDNTKKTIGCMDRSSSSAKSIAKCDGVPYSECFWLTTPDGKQCLQNTTTQKCEASTITSCADYKTYDNCNFQACYWNDTTNACTVLTCAKLPKESCFLFLSYDSTSVTFCLWNTTTNVCQDLDLTTLKDAQCLDNTLYSYLWNPDSSKCELCVSGPTTESSAQKISLAGILLISLFV